MNKLLLTVILTAISTTASAGYKKCYYSNLLDSNLLKTIRKVDPLKKGVNNLELNMIEQTVNYGRKDKVYGKKALGEFLDLPYKTNAGDIMYARAPSGAVYAYTLYYPGDNPYGLLFAFGKDKMGNTTIMPVAAIEDGDANCALDKK